MSSPVARAGSRSPVKLDRSRRPERLARWTTLRVGGAPDRFAVPAGIEEVRDLISDCTEAGEPWRVLGKGSNLIVSDDGVPGTVIHTRGLRWFQDVGDGRVVVGAGTPTSVLLAETRRRGLGGLECLVGYPATIGGAVRMNAGGRWGETGSRVVSLTAVGPSGRVVSLTPEECRFGYRTSALSGFVVVEVTLLLPHTEPAEYGQRIDAIHRAKGEAQPLDRPSAGCVFRNPGPGVSAGRLVDESGLLGESLGGAQVSEKHGNFIVNTGSATAQDVLGLIHVVRDEVARRTDVLLELEVEVWSPDDVPASV